MTDDLRPVVNFLYEMGLLKRSKRTGWWTAGIKDPETIAEHSFRVALVGYILASMDGADANRTAMMCLFHDSQETRTGDIEAIGKRYLTSTSPQRITADQTSGFPTALGTGMNDLVEEYEARETREAQLAHDADKLELVLQAREYEAQGGYDTSAWRENSLDGLTSQTARRLAEVACQVPPDQWWQAFREIPTTSNHLAD